jgi:ATP phosphoribosyltransferase regulatory subunit HisZ
MSGRNEVGEQIRIMRALAFQIHRKRPAAEVLGDCIEEEGRGGRHRQWRSAAASLEAEGFVSALQAAGLVSEDVAAVLSVVVAAKDHRLLSDALSALADFYERQSPP